MKKVFVLEVHLDKSLWTSMVFWPLSPSACSSSPLRICLSQAFPGSGVKGPVTVTLDEQTSACFQFFHIFSIFFLEDKQLLIVETLEYRSIVQRLCHQCRPKNPLYCCGLCASRISGASKDCCGSFQQAKWGSCCSSHPVLLLLSACDSHCLFLIMVV